MQKGDFMSKNAHSILMKVQELENNELYEEAVKELEKVADKFSDDAEFVKTLAMDYEVLNRPEDAIIYWEKYKKLAPNEPISYSQLIDLYFTKDKFEYYCNRAKLKIIEQKPAQAIDDYKKAIANTDNQENISDTRLLLGVLYEALGKTTNAIDEYLRLTDVEDDIDIYYRLINLYQKEGNNELLHFMHTAIQKFPDEVEFKEITAKLYHKSGDLDKALKYAQSDLLKTKIYLEQNKNDKAFEFLKNYNISNKKSDELINYYSLMAEYYYNLDEYDKAFTQLNEIEKLAPNNLLLHQMRAILYEAEKKEFQSHLSWAKYYELRGENQLVNDELLNAHSIEPQNIDIIKKLIKNYENLNDKHAALEFCEKLYKIDEKDFSVLRKLGEFYFAEGEYSVAVNFLEKLYVLNKSDYKNLKLLADAYEKIKDFESAKQALEKYVSLAPVGTETEIIKNKISKMGTPNYQESSSCSDGFLDKIITFFTKQK